MTDISNGIRITQAGQVRLQPPEVPDAFGADQWSLGTDGADVILTIIALPKNNGRAITALEYRAGDGSVLALGGAMPGEYQITADYTADVQMRALNSIGAGPWSEAKVVPVPLPQATGGTVTEITDPSDGLNYTVHTFTGNGTLTVTVGGEFEYFVLPGGGAGANSADTRAGNGGGAGGYPVSGTQVIEPGTLAVVVGAGGAPVSAASPGGNGGNSSLGAIASATGGAGGVNGYHNNNADNQGGEGGNNAMFSGGARNVDSSVARRGGSGGAGAGGNGQQGVLSAIGAGGVGVSVSISGTATVYGRGGDGSSQGTTAFAEPANSGNGGCAASDAAMSGAGGSGVVIVRYTSTEANDLAEA